MPALLSAGPVTGNAMKLKTIAWLLKSGQLILLLRQLSLAGFERPSAVSLVPGDNYYAFLGYNS